MNRYSCDQAAVKRLPPDALEEFGGAEFVTSVDAILFVEQSWLSKKVLLGDSTSSEYKQVVNSSIDGHPSVLLESSGEGSAGFSSWMIVTEMPNGGIGAAKRPENDHRNNVHLAQSETLREGYPSIRGDSLIVESEIQEPSDANCCPSGGVVQSHYSLNQGILRIASTKRLRRKK
jgi:hypothetical protein